MGKTRSLFVGPPFGGPATQQAASRKIKLLAKLVILISLMSLLISFFIEKSAVFYKECYILTGLVLYGYTSVIID